jgi:hypothetical protein
MTDEIWTESVGSIPFKVTVMEMATRKRVLYLQWRDAGNWQYRSLKPAAAKDGLESATLYDLAGARLTGRALAQRKKWALEQAEEMFARLKAGLSPADRAEASPLTLGQTWKKVSDVKTGLYPVVTPHRKEVEREFGHVSRILKPDTRWAAIRRKDLRELWRTRIQELQAAGHEGLRGAEISITRLLAIAQWLRDEELIPADSCVAPSTWREELRKDWQLLTGSDRLPTPARPRYTPDEFRTLLDAAWKVDPRFGLMYALGAELRGGQMKRGRRSDLTLPEMTPETSEFGELRVPGSGKKRGTVVHLTRGQRASVDRAIAPETGYLRELEAAYLRAEIADYFLFPASSMPGKRAHRRGRGSRHDSKWRVTDHTVVRFSTYTAKHVGDTAINKWMRATEQRAGIPHVEGRSWYGGRRVGVDMAKGAKISREGLQEAGGWTDSQVPDAIYSEQERSYARREARDVRAKYRGEE